MDKRTVHGVAQVNDERVGDVADVSPDVVRHQNLQADDGLRVEHCVSRQSRCQHF